MTVSHIKASIEAGPRIRSACTALGLAHSSAQVDLLERYIEGLIRWNKTYNLTALRDPEQMLVQHVFDSLAPLIPLYTRCARTTPSRICDIGSGGGLPGVVIAIMAPEWEVICIDAVEKKTAFIQQMIGTLRLPNLRARHARVETLPAQNADIVISRAFASLIDFVSLSALHVVPDGHMVAMKGKMPDEEISTLHAQSDWRVADIQTLNVPELDAQRCLVWMHHQQGNS